MQHGVIVFDEYAFAVSESKVLIRVKITPAAHCLMPAGEGILEMLTRNSSLALRTTQKELIIRQQCKNEPRDWPTIPNKRLYANESEGGRPRRHRLKSAHLT